MIRLAIVLGLAMAGFACHASTITSGELRFTRTIFDGTDNLASFAWNMPFLRGHNGADFAIFDLPIVPSDFGFTGIYRPREAYSGGTLIPNATIMSDLMLLAIAVPPEHGTAITIPFKYFLEWTLNDASGTVLHELFVHGTGLASLQFGNDGNRLDAGTLELDMSGVPEPITMTLTGIGLLAIGLRKFRQRRPV